MPPINKKQNCAVLKKLYCICVHGWLAPYGGQHKVLQDKISPGVQLDACNQGKVSNFIWKSVGYPWRFRTFFLLQVYSSDSRWTCWELQDPSVQPGMALELCSCAKSSQNWLNILTAQLLYLCIHYRPRSLVMDQIEPMGHMLFFLVSRCGFDMGQI